MPGIISLFKASHVGVVVLALFYCSTLRAEDWVYTVRGGDTLWDLCLEYTTVANCWQRIGPYNGVEYPRSLAPGTRIKFPAAWLKNQPVSVELVYRKGSVSVKTVEELVREANVGEMLAIGSTVETKENSSATLRFADGAILVLEENSVIVLDSLSQHGEAGMVDSKIRLLRGTSKAKVPVREPRSSFSVTSPSAVAAVRGTDFRVTAVEGAKVGESPAMLGSVYEGVIVVASNSQTDNQVPVKTGYGIKAEKGKALGEPKKLLAAPQFLTSTDTQFYPLNIDWEDIPGAESYIIEVLDNAEEDKLLESMAGQVSQAQIEMSDNACFRIRVSALDDDSLKGMPSELRLCGEIAPPEPVVEEKDRTKEVLLFLLIGLLVSL